MEDIKNFLKMYRQEAEELLTNIEETVLEIEENPSDREAVNRLFRAVHTIKGSGAMFGFDEVAQFTHFLETVLDKVREGVLPVTKELIDLILKSRDHIKSILNCAESGESADAREEEEIRAGLNLFLNLADDNKVVFNSEKLDAIKSMELDHEITCRIRFKPHQSIYSTGTDPASLLEELRELGDCEITPQPRDVPVLEDLDPEKCYLFWDIVLTTNSDLNSVRDVFIFVEDDADLIIDVIDDETNPDEENEGKRIGEILVERKDIDTDQLNEVLSKQKRLGEMLVESESVDSGAVKSALVEQNRIKKIMESRKEGKESSSLRVGADKLDNLVDLVGELVTVQARLSQFSSTMEDPDLLSIAEEVERLTAELRDNTMSIRMMPIGTTFSKFKRLVRDLSNELGKNIELITSGAETELDKTMIDRLDDPLIHLIRNSIDHGIESPEKRMEKGKGEKGTIKLSAAHRGAYVTITIEDDGRGLDVDSILAKAIEKNLVPKETRLTEKEIFELIFMPGFSTSEKISNVSGRGVGMDVVKKTIESLRGSTDVESEPGQWTRITLKLPLTLAIINGLLVSINNVHYVLPLASVEECVELTRQRIDQAHGAKILNVRGEIVPYVRLRESFDVRGNRPDLEHVVIVNVNDKRVGFVVDNVLGGHQTVIKSLGPVFRHKKDISGATILGDGTVALILDVSNLALK